MYGNYAFSFHATKMVTYLSILVALIVPVSATYIAKEINLNLLFLGIGASEVLVIFIMRDRRKMLRRELKYLDSLLEKLDNNQPLGTMENILSHAPK
jgi:hypothetical protein